MRSFIGSAPVRRAAPSYAGYRGYSYYGYPRATEESRVTWST